MSREKETDPLLEWGPEAAVIVFVASVLGAVALVLYAVMQGGNIESAAVPALITVVIGGLVAFGIMVVRKRRERATRPAWMGSTQEWREDLTSRHSGSGTGGKGDPPPGAAG
jgi:uncharacterized membrane protein YccC